MKDSVGVRFLSLLILVAAMVFSPIARAQDNSDVSKGVDSGGYNIHQTIEFGYRGNWVGGNQNNYNTFLNLGEGVRLFDYTLEMRSLDHQGLLFDNLSFSNFGYGGDPNDVSRLHIDKNKWYDFQVLFRRDKNFWNYNLLANPLNPASSNPAIAITNSPHALDLVRRMQDYNLTLLPQSRLRFRLGYSRNVNEGPAFTTTDGATIPQLTTAFRTTVNAYRMGVDVRFLPKTTFSYDQFLKYYRQDNVTTDQNLNYQLSDGTPVDLGIIWNTAGRTPCAAPFPVTPGVANPTCNGFATQVMNGTTYQAYSSLSRPRDFLPTERFGFQSSYFKNLEMSGSVGYSTSDNSIPDFSEVMNGFTSRTFVRTSLSSGPARAKRVSVNADWSAIYSVTDKLRIMDAFRYDNWRIPSAWAFSNTNLFPAGAPNMLTSVADIANFTSVCPPPFTAATCPNHNTSSDADISTGLISRFLGQNIKENTIQVQYDFSKRLSARVGYLYQNRKVADFFSTFYTAETYFPGPSVATALRGDCSDPAACTANGNGSYTFSGLSSTSDTSRNITDINHQAVLLGLTARPIDTLRIGADFEFGSSDYAYTRISPRQVQSYKFHATYAPLQWVSIDGAVNIHENRDNVYEVNNLEHDRTYSFTTVLSPNAQVSFDLGYTYTDYYSQTFVCYYLNAFGPPPVNQCPADMGYGAPPPNPALSFYSSKQHFAYFDVMWKPIKRVSTTFGYSGTFVGGNTLFLNPLQPAGPLAFNFHKPYANIQFDLYKGFSYKMGWNYYGYNGKAPFNVAGLQPIGNEDFNGSTATFAFRYSF